MRMTRVCLVLLLLLFLNALALATSSYTSKFKIESNSELSRLYVVIRNDPGRHNSFGFIDRTGKLVIDFDKLPKTTRNLGEFHEGLAVIYLEHASSGKSTMGYIDRTGTIVIGPRFDYARDFSEGLAYVETKTFHGFINHQGKVVINLEPLGSAFGTSIEGLGAKDFHEGRAAVGTGRWDEYQLSRDDSNTWGGRWGYIDSSGKLIIKPLYKFADNFSEGRAGVVVNEPGYKIEATYGFIDRDGLTVILPQFSPRRGGPHYFGIGGTTIFRDGLARVKTLEGFYGFIDKNGAFVVAPKLMEATDFSDGFAWAYTVNTETGAATKVGWLDTSGRWAITDLTNRKEAQHAQVVFSEGLAAAPLELPDGSFLWGYINHKGVEVIKPKFQAAGPFKGGIAEVSITEPWLGEAVEYIDKQGHYIWKSKWISRHRKRR